MGTSEDMYVPTYENLAQAFHQAQLEAWPKCAQR